MGVCVGVGLVWGERGDLFSHDLVFLAGPASNPLFAAPPPDGLCMRPDWQFGPLLGILAFLSVIPLTVLPLLPAVCCPLRTSILAVTIPLWVGTPSTRRLCIDTSVSTPRHLSRHGRPAVFHLRQVFFLRRKEGAELNMLKSMLL